MTQLERQISATQRRLWLNRWFRYACWCLAAAATIFAAVVLGQRSYAAPISVGWVAIGLTAAALVTSMVWTALRREGPALAAATLDEAAGLRERISTGRYCLDSADPFAQAVVADAERISSSLSPRQHIRLTTPRPLAWTTGSVLLASLMFFVPSGWLAKTDAKQALDPTAETEETKVAVKRKMDAIRQMAETTPALEDLRADLARLDKDAGGKLERPGDIRHEAAKKIDQLADAVKQKQKSQEYDAVRAMKKELRGLKVPQSENAPTEKLAKALSQGDFKTAAEEVKAIKEQLATLKSETDKEMADKISRQLDELSKQLEQAAKNEKLAEKLEQAGVKKEDVQRMLENLKKEDLEQLKKQLEEKGLNQQQIQSLAQQLQQQQQAGAVAKKLAQSMQQGSKCNNPGQMGEAMAGLSQAGDQLSELEQLEQEMGQLESTLDALQSAKDDLDNPCSGCNGSGMQGDKQCGQCQGSGSQNQGQGSGMGSRIGRGQGGLAQSQEANVGFKTERAKVHTGQGAIIGQFLVDGEQVKGEVTSQVVDLVSAAERDASDRISRDRVPRQYQKAIKAYFANVRRTIKAEKADEAAPPTEGADGKDAEKTESDGNSTQPKQDNSSKP